MNGYAGLVLAAFLSTRITAATSAEPLRFTPSDHPTACPAQEHPKNGCLAVTGTNLDPKSHWRRFERTALLGEGTAAVPAGCIAVRTIDALISAQSLLHFKGEGQCPKTDTASYHLVFEAAEARRSGMSTDGTINYDGGRNLETYSTSVS